MEPENAALPDTVTLRCVKEANRLRVKIVSPGYAQAANCQFPKDIRVEGREYVVPRRDVAMANTQGKFFYRIKKTNIKILESRAQASQTNSASLQSLKVYGDENLSECAICLQGPAENPGIIFVILVPCGHYALCDACAYNCKERAGTCPLCRARIEQVITKAQLQ
jgi:hypothetical protein